MRISTLVLTLLINIKYHQPAATLDRSNPLANLETTSNDVTVLENVFQVGVPRGAACYFRCIPDAVFIDLGGFPEKIDQLDNPLTRSLVPSLILLTDPTTISYNKITDVAFSNIWQMNKCDRP